MYMHYLVMKATRATHIVIGTHTHTHRFPSDCYTHLLSFKIISVITFIKMHNVYTWFYPGKLVNCHIKEISTFLRTSKVKGKKTRLIFS